MTNQAARVGILGGMGPAATADFYAKVVATTPAIRDQDHLPVVIWADPRVPDRTAALLGRGADPTPWLLVGARQLVDAGADFLVIPCNTAHAYLDAIRTEVAPVPVLNMVAETATVAANRRPCGHIGVLATRGTLHAGLYQHALSQLGLTPLLPGYEEQEGVSAAIQTIKAAGSHERARNLIAPAVHQLEAAGADLLVAACTELPLLFAACPSVTIPLVDPTAVLASATVREATQSPAHRHRSTAATSSASQRSTMTLAPAEWRQRTERTDSCSP